MWPTWLFVLLILQGKPSIDQHLGQHGAGTIAASGSAVDTINLGKRNMITIGPNLLQSKLPELPDKQI